MTQIVPITEMRNTSKMFEMSENQPVYITKNGYGSRVLLNIEMYNKVKELLLDLELEERFQKSETDGHNEEAHQFLKRLINERVYGREPSDHNTLGYWFPVQVTNTSKNTGERSCEPGQME